MISGKNLFRAGILSAGLAFSYGVYAGDSLRLGFVSYYSGKGDVERVVETCERSSCDGLVAIVNSSENYASRNEALMSNLREVNSNLPVRIVSRSGVMYVSNQNHFDNGEYILGTGEYGGIDVYFKGKRASNLRLGEDSLITGGGFYGVVDRGGDVIDFNSNGGVSLSREPNTEIVGK